ncbi:hypothetical protein ACJMK2_031771 [Sinanodonta woodiana]|uniref:Uncharacterized protein n=1 Tax=Sinanodonta woodiana TaxID=1069815 RepID=A0ABD3X3P2_SINWO
MENCVVCFQRVRRRHIYVQYNACQKWIQVYVRQYRQLCRADETLSGCLCKDYVSSHTWTSSQNTKATCTFNTDTSFKVTENQEESIQKPTLQLRLNHACQPDYQISLTGSKMSSSKLMAIAMIWDATKEHCPCTLLLECH